MGKGKDWIREEVDKRLKAYLSKNVNTDPINTLGTVEFIEFTNPEKSRGKTKSGIEVDTIPKGSVDSTGYGIQVSPNAYVVGRSKTRPKSIDGSFQGYVLYSDLNFDSQDNIYYIRKVGNSTFYQFTPPTITEGALDWVLNIASPQYLATSLSLGTVSSSFFLSKSSLFCKFVRVGGDLYPQNPDLDEGEINILTSVLRSWKLKDDIVSPIVEYTPNNHSYTLQRSDLAGAPSPVNTNTLIYSISNQNTTTFTPGSGLGYTWTRVYTATWENDVDSYFIGLQAAKEDQRPGPYPTTAVGDSDAVRINATPSSSGVILDAVCSYSQSNQPLVKKRLSQEVWHYTGVFDPFGTPAEFELRITLDYSYGNTNPLTGTRAVTRDYTYEFIKADLHGGTLYSHVPLELLIHDSSGTYTESTWSELINPLSDFYVDTLSNFESTLLGGLPTYNFSFTDQEASGDYEGPVRSVLKIVSMENFNNVPTVNSLTFYDTETYLTESIVSTSGTVNTTWNYSNSSFGGSSVFDESGAISIVYTAESIQQVNSSVTHTQLFPNMDYNLQTPYVTGSFRKNSSSGGISVVVSDLSWSRVENYVENQVALEDDIQTSPVNAKPYVITDLIADIGPSIFGSDSYPLYKTINSTGIVYLTFTRVPEFIGPTVTIEVARYAYNQETEIWSKGISLNEDWSSSPLDPTKAALDLRDWAIFL